MTSPVDNRSKSQNIYKSQDCYRITLRSVDRKTFLVQKGNNGTGHINYFLLDKINTLNQINKLEI